MKEVSSGSLGPFAPLSSFHLELGNQSPEVGLEGEWFRPRRIEGRENGLGLAQGREHLAAGL
jgi:hypothetical protein